MEKTIKDKIGDALPREEFQRYVGDALRIVQEGRDYDVSIQTETEEFISCQSGYPPAGCCYGANSECRGVHTKYIVTLTPKP